MTHINVPDDVWALWLQFQEEYPNNNEAPRFYSMCFMDEETSGSVLLREYGYERSNYQTLLHFVDWDELKQWLGEQLASFKVVPPKVRPSHLPTAYRVWDIKFYDEAIINAIINKTKTIETRVLNPEEPARYFGNIKYGDQIVLRHGNDEYWMIVTHVVVFPTIESFSAGVDFSQVLPGAQSIMTPGELVEAYNRLHPGYGDKLAKNGAVAFIFMLV